MPKFSSSLLTASLLGATLVTLSGCIIVDADEGDFHSEWNSDRSYGTLKGADVANNEVTIRVTSNGCTTKDFISTDVRKMKSERFSVGFYRTKEDYCRANLPDGVALTWSFAELGIPEGAEVSVRNSVSN